MQQDRLAFVDTLRATAAIAVLTYHLPLVGDFQALLPGWLQHALLVLGASGIDLFFCISGFVLCLMMPNYDDHRQPVVAFYIKRVLRIAPLFFVVLSGWVLAFAVKGRAIDGWQIATELTFTFNLDPRTAMGFAFADWTIGVEMLFYAIFPLLYRLIPGPRSKLVALVLAFPLFELVMLAYQQGGFEPALLDRFRGLTIFHHAPTFLLGMLVYDLYRRLGRWKHVAMLGVGAMLMALLLFADALSDQPLLGRFTVTLGWGALLFASCLRPWFFVNRYTAWVGRISYSMYLWHGPIIMAMAAVFATILGLALPVAVPLCLVATLLVVLPFAWLSYRFIETPGNRLATRLVRWLDRPAAAPGEGFSRSPRP